MLSYAFRMAVHSLKRNRFLTSLMFLAVAIGIAGAMSTYTIYYAMSGDPIPWKSATLFTPQIDAWGPAARDENGEPSDQLTYQDAVALMRAGQPQHRAAMYRTALTLTPEGIEQIPFLIRARATFRDFFTLFDVPMRQGAAWTQADETAAANDVVLSAKLANRLFPRQSATGRTVTLNDKQYRVVGVTGEWNPAPRFYEVGRDAMADSEDLFLPFTTAIDRQMSSDGHTSCNHDPDAGSGWEGLLASDCTWIQFWVELRNPAEVSRYRAFLNHYAEEQRRVGRFNWPPLTRLRDVRAWLAYKRVVPDQLRTTTLLGFGFLVVCLVNSIGLMLAKFASHGGELAVRRALGASKAQLFLQCLTETAVIGAVGGVLGLVLTLLGVAAERAILPSQLAHVAHVDLVLATQTLVLAVLATICVGIFPAWRASRQYSGKLQSS